MNRPLVTIVTPSYNQAQFIRATIESVLAQTYPHIEYLVIDGGSTDTTLSILREYDGRLRYVSEEDAGQADAINKGFGMARGEIVAWLNSDDVYYPDAVATAVDFLATHPDVAMVYGDGDIIDAEGRVVKRFSGTEPYDLWRLIHVWDYVLQPATFFRRSAWEDVGGLDTGLHWCLDWDLWIKVGLRYPIAYLPEVLACSREYEATKTSTGGWKRLREIRAVMARYTHDRFPPGLFLYGTSTLMTAVDRNAWAYRLLAPLGARVMARTLRTAPGRFPDGWVGPRAHIWLPGPETKCDLGISGVVHPVPGLLPLQVEVWSGGHRCSFWVLKEEGHFLLRTALPAEVQDMPVVPLEMRCSRSFVPGRLIGTGDGRRLSIQVNSVTWVGE
jgi:GT2 family glycosyltransferase